MNKIKIDHNKMNIPGFSLLDYAIFAIMLIISACIGIYYGFVGRNSTGKEMLIANRKMTVRKND